MWSSLLVTVTFALPLLVQGQSSLWIPGLDEQPISVGLLGVGNDGRTTWELQQGTPTGALTNPSDFGFPGKGTLIEGQSDAVLSAVFTAIDGGPTEFAAVYSESCAISDGTVAACVDAWSQGGTVSTDTQTETVSSFVVQAGGSQSSGSPLSGTAPTAVPSRFTTGSTSSSTAIAGSSPTTSSPQPTESNAACRHQTAHGLFFLGIVGSVVYSVLLII